MRGELARRLQNLGHEVEIKDFLDATPFRMGKAADQRVRSRAPPRPMGL